MRYPVLPNELLDLVAEMLLVESYSKPEDFRTALRNMALTCRAFYEPAMNIAWHTLHTLRPVVKCFPENIWEQDDDGQVVCQIILTIPF